MKKCQGTAHSFEYFFAMLSCSLAIRAPNFQVVQLPSLKPCHAREPVVMIKITFTQTLHELNEQQLWHCSVSHWRA